MLLKFIAFEGKSMLQRIERRRAEFIVNVARARVVLAFYNVLACWTRCGIGVVGTSRGSQCIAGTWVQRSYVYSLNLRPRNSHFFCQSGAPMTEPTKPKYKLA